MGINNEIYKNTADNERIRFLNYLKALKSDGLIDDFIDLDDSTQSRLKSNEIRGDFLVQSEEYKIAIELKSRILGNWKHEEEVIKKLNTIDTNNAFEQLLKNHYQFKDVGENASYRDFIWADPKSANSWNNKRKRKGKKQLRNTVNKYHDVTHCIIIYSHRLLPFFPNKNGTSFLVPTKWSEYFKNEGVRLFNEVHLPFDIFKNFKKGIDQLIIGLILLEKSLLKDSIKINELPQLIDGTYKEQIAIVGVKDADISEAVFNFNNKLEIKNSCINPLPSEIVRKLKRDEREVRVSKIKDKFLTLFYHGSESDFETNALGKSFAQDYKALDECNSGLETLQQLQKPESERSEWMKELLKDPSGWAIKEAHKILNEIKGKKNDRD